MRLSLVSLIFFLSALAFAAPNNDYRRDILERRAKIKFNGEVCSKSVQCFSYNCDRARCRDKKDVGASCYKNANCYSGNCQDKRVCAAAIATPSPTTSSFETNSVITRTVTITVTISPLTTPTSCQNQTTSADTPPSAGGDGENGTSDGGSIDIPSGGTDGGEIPIDGGDGAIVFSPAPLPSIDQIIASIKAGGDPFFNGVGPITTQSEDAAAQKLMADIRTQQAVLQAQRITYLAQKTAYSKAPLPQNLIESLDGQIDAALARLQAASDRFNAILDSLTESVQQRGETLSGLRDRA